jgi:(S)-2-hydroxy-acid oxidase
MNDILTAGDEEAAVENKADGTWVSSYGGHRLGACPSSLDAPPEIVSVLRSSRPEIPILFDSTIRRGTDVFKAPALGANLCFIERPTLRGLAYHRQVGVDLVLETLENERRLTMGFADVRNLEVVSRSHLGYVKEGIGMQPFQ